MTFKQRMFADLALRAFASLTSPGGRRARLSILIYHRVLPGADALNTWDVTAAAFDAQMRALAAQFTTLPLSEAVERLETGSLPPRAACVTFDDGYADNAEIALPILQRHNVRATFFVASGYLNGGRMWNDTVVESIRVCPGEEIDLRGWGLGILPLQALEARREAIRRILFALKHLPPAEREAKARSLADRGHTVLPGDLMMRDDQLRKLRGAGMEIGAHTVTHPILTQIPESDARREIVEGRAQLSEVLREPVSLFAYPNGKPGQDYAAEHVRMVREAGFRAAVSTAWGSASSRSDLFQLPRFTPWDRDPLRFSLRLSLHRRNVSSLIV